MFNPVKLITVVLSVVICCQSLAQSSTSLSRWIKAEAAPQLAGTLAKHPKFRGETLSFGAMENQRPEPHSNKLLAQFSQQFIQQVLKTGKNDIAAARHHCPATDADYYIGLTLSKQSSGRYTLQIRALDLNTGYWVGGISQTWEGRLSRSELQALNTPAVKPLPGSAGAPLASLDSPQFIEALERQLKCARLAEQPGTLALNEDSPPEHTRIQQAVKAYLGGHPGLKVSAQSQADYVLNIESQPAGPLTRFAVSMGRRLDNQRRDLAQIYVKRSVVTSADPDRNDVIPDRPVLDTFPPRDTTVAGKLLSRINRSKDRDCRDCLRFELKKDAYVLVFTTIGEHLAVSSCTQAYDYRHSSTYQFRVKEKHQPVSLNRPRYGFYVVATSDPNMAQTLADRLQAASQQCGGEPSTGLPDLLAHIQDAGQSLDWRAYHAINYFGGES